MKSNLANSKQIQDEVSLLNLMTEPREALVEAMKSIPGPLVVVGAGGKMGPSLCLLAKRAAELGGNPLRIIALSRFSNPSEREWLESNGIETQSFDALSTNEEPELPDASHLVYLVGMKFGTDRNPELTWATNTLAPARVATRYAGVPTVALSTGNVYPMSRVDSAGPDESSPLTPQGEYANAAVARERIFEHFSKTLATPVALLRLNYALDLRYGILVDLAQSILAERPIDLSMGYVNCIWQGDANDRILRSFSLVKRPAVAFNLTSPRAYAVRDLASELGRHLGISPRFEGTPSETALLSDASRLTRELGEPETPIDDVIGGTAHWVKNGGKLLGRPTKFQVRDGGF